MSTSRSSGSARSRLAPRLLAGLVALAALAAGTEALADRRVVIDRFTGPQAARNQAQVRQVVARRHQVVPTTDWRRAQRRLKATSATNRNVARVAADRKVDAVLTGSVRRVRGRWQAQIVVRAGKTGRVVETVRVPLRSPRIDARAQQAIADALLPVVARVPAIAPAREPAARGGGRPEPPPEREARPAPPPKPERRPPPPVVEAPPEPDPWEEPERPVALAGSGGGEVDARIARGGDDRPARDDVAPRGPRDPRDAGVDVHLGPGASMRRLSFTVRPGLANRPPGYRGAPVPTAVVRGDVYPLAGRGGALAGLGLGVDVDHVLYIRSRLETGGPKIPTSQSRWGLGARWRFLLGGATGPTVTLGAGLGRLTFAIDAGDLAIELPDAGYTFVDLGAAGRIPLGAGRWSLLAEARWLAVLSSGEMQAMENYGGGSVAGLEGGAGLEWRPSPRLGIRAGLRYTRIAHAFDGTGARTNRDADPDQDVGGALDQFFGASGTIGYQF
jgi:hypothetical protein